MIRQLTVVSICLLLSVCADYPCQRDAAFSLSQVQQDFNELRDRILQNHPMSFAAREDVTRAFDLQYSRLKDSMTITEFYRDISAAVSAVNCGHTRLSFPGCIGDDLYRNGNSLPFDIRVVRDSLVVLKCYTPELVMPPGSIILSINGMQTSEIIERIKTSLPADGSNETYKYYLMNQYFNRRYMDGVGEAIDFEVEYIVPQFREPNRVTVRAMTLSEIRKLIQTLPAGDSGRQTIETSIDDDSRYAILTIRFFDYYDNLNRFADQIDTFFQTLQSRRIESLILDLRGNDGGDPYCSAYLLGYLIGKPFRYFTSRSTFLVGDLKDVQAIPENPFRGELYVLVDGGCYSTTGHFLSLLRSHGKGLLVGEETGGSYMCNGGFREHRLTHTGIELLLPYATFVADAEGLERGRGIKPDVFADYSVDDVLNGDDPVLDTALAIIQGRN